MPREDLAKIHLDLLRNGAIGVGWVLAFPHADRFGGDVYLKSALAYAPSVIALFENDNGIYPKTTGTVILGDDVGGYLSQGTVKNNLSKFRWFLTTSSIIRPKSSSTKSGFKFFPSHSPLKAANFSASLVSSIGSSLYSAFRRPTL